MKTLLTYIIVASMGLMLVHSDEKEVRLDYVAPLESLPLNDDDLISVDHFTIPVLHTISAPLPKKKEYHIYFENKSQKPMKAAVRYKEYEGGWVSEGWISLEPGEKKLIGLSDETTYFYYAQLGDNKRDKKVWKGKYKFAMSEEAPNKLPFKKQDIWECYHTQMCNTFAVFR